MIDWEQLPDDLLQALRPVSATAHAAVASNDADTPPDLRTLSQQTIARTVAQCDGNLSEAARLLGISRNTLYRRRVGMTTAAG